jgi:RHS repeat-associated protein
LTGIYNYKSNGTLITYATYTYDPVGNRLSMSTSEGNYTYSYDAIYRLTGEVNPIGGTYSYTYDAVGNRLSMTHNGQTINYVYDAGNKLLQAGNTTFTYDGNGNMVSKTENGQTTTYVYNYEDKMVQVNLPNGSSIVYSYDHSGKRIAKTAGGTTIDYYFDGDDLIAEAQGSSILAYYTQGSGLISQRRNNASYFYHYDGLGSTKALTDANQNIQNTTKYDAWGNILQSSGTTTNPYLYVGELGYYGDGDAGMYLLTQRWYNPVVGRFVSGDPLDNLNTLKNYVYCLGNPILFVDPLGLKECGPWLTLSETELKPPGGGMIRHISKWVKVDQRIATAWFWGCHCCFVLMDFVERLHIYKIVRGRVCWEPNKKCPKRSWLETLEDIERKWVSEGRFPFQMYPDFPQHWCKAGVVVVGHVEWTPSGLECRCNPPSGVY